MPPTIAPATNIARTPLFTAARRTSRVERVAVRPCFLSTSAVPMTIPVAMANGHAPQRERGDQRDSHCDNEVIGRPQRHLAIRQVEHWIRLHGSWVAVNPGRSESPTAACETLRHSSLFHESRTSCPGRPVRVPSVAPMSSCGGEGRPPGCLVGSKAAEHLVTDPSAEGPDGLGLGVADGAAVLEMGLGPVVDPHLGDLDPVQGQVELAVATRERRWRVTLPDQTGTGALPLWRANASLEWKRHMPAPYLPDSSSRGVAVRAPGGAPFHSVSTDEPDPEETRLRYLARRQGPLMRNGSEDLELPRLIPPAALRDRCSRSWFPHSRRIDPERPGRRSRDLLPGYG